MGGPGSGGFRANAGQSQKKVRNFGEERKKGLAKALAAKAKETGKSLEEVAVDIAYDNSAHLSSRVGALKMIYDILVPKESHRTVEQTVSHSGPLILPELAPDPAAAPEPPPAEEERH